MNAMVIAVMTFQLAAGPSDSVVSRFEEHHVRYTGGEYEDEEFGYRLLKPSTVESDKRYPLVLFLHGAGERGDDNRMQLLYFPAQMSQEESRNKYPCFLVAPQCRKGKWWVAPGQIFAADGRPSEPTHQQNVAMAALEEVLEKCPIDRRRIYLTGLSMGGYGSWDMAARHPRLFAAVVPICGGGSTQNAEVLANVPIWAVHGDADPVVPVSRSRTMIDAIKAAGGSPKYTELKGVGHNSWTAAYEDPKGVIPWMFQQVNAVDPVGME